MSSCQVSDVQTQTGSWMEYSSALTKSQSQDDDTELNGQQKEASYFPKHLEKKQRSGHFSFSKRKTTVRWCCSQIYTGSDFFFNYRQRQYTTKQSDRLPQGCLWYVRNFQDFSLRQKTSARANVSLSGNLIKVTLLFSIVAMFPMPFNLDYRVFFAKIKKPLFDFLNHTFCRAAGTH